VLEAFNFDQYFLSALTHHLREFYWFFYTVTMVGSPTAVTILASIAFILGKNKIKVFAAILLIGLLFSFFVVDDLKDIVKRPRPPGINTARYLITNNYSFPSGHALTIFLAAAVLGAYYGWKYRLIGYILAFIVSISRVYLGVHYPTDIIAGAIIGTFLGELLIYAAYRYGLCDNAGLLSLLQKPGDIKTTGNGYRANIPFPVSLIVFISAALILILYSYNEYALAICLPSALFMLVILYMVRHGTAFDKGLILAFVFISAGIIGALALDALQAYALSLVLIAAAYVSCLALSLNRGTAT